MVAADHSTTEARQLAELARAEAKALNPENMQAAYEIMDDMGAHMEQLGLHQEVCL